MSLCLQALDDKECNSITLLPGQTFTLGRQVELGSFRPSVPRRCAELIVKLDGSSVCAQLRVLKHIFLAPRDTVAAIKLTTGDDRLVKTVWAAHLVYGTTLKGFKALQVRDGDQLYLYRRSDGSGHCYGFRVVTQQEQRKAGDKRQADIPSVFPQKKRQALMAEKAQPEALAGLFTGLCFVFWERRVIPCLPVFHLATMTSIAGLFGNHRGHCFLSCCRAVSCSKAFNLFTP